MAGARRAGTAAEAAARTRAGRLTSPTCAFAVLPQDTSARLQARPCNGTAAAAVPPAPAAGGPPPRAPALAVWDTLHFARIARCGYETDMLAAFFPLVPGVMAGWRGAAGKQGAGGAGGGWGVGALGGSGSSMCSGLVAAGGSCVRQCWALGQGRGLASRASDLRA